MDTRWCNYFNCWIKDVEEITEESAECGYQCLHCSECDKFIKQFKRNIIENLNMQ